MRSIYSLAIVLLAGLLHLPVAMADHNYIHTNSCNVPLELDFEESFFFGSDLQVVFASFTVKKRAVAKGFAKKSCQSITYSFNNPNGGLTCPFDGKPSITLSMNSLDSDEARNLRYSTFIDQSTMNGSSADVIFRTWGDTQINWGVIHLTAIGEREGNSCAITSIKH